MDGYGLLYKFQIRLLFWFDVEFPSLAQPLFFFLHTYLYTNSITHSGLTLYSSSCTNPPLLFGLFWLFSNTLLSINFISQLGSGNNNLLFILLVKKRMISFKELWTKKTLLGLGLGQFLSLLITSTGFSSSELARKGLFFRLNFSFFSVISCVNCVWNFHSWFLFGGVVYGFVFRN